jgi:hemolysin-activating ACP:hemolysin acyltransferase
MKRMINETFEDYKVRRKEDKENTRKKLKGKLIWGSKYVAPFGSRSSYKSLNQGTYIKKEHENASI